MKHKRLLTSALFFAVIAALFFASSSSVSAASTVSTCMMKSSGDSQVGGCSGSLDVVGMVNTPLYAQDTEPQTCANWHISINGAKPFDGCAAHMGESHVGEYVLFGPHEALEEYQVTNLDKTRQNVAVTFVQKWIPNGTNKYPYLLLLFDGECDDVWKVEIIGVPSFCTMAMPVSRQGQYVEVAGAGEIGEFWVGSVDFSQRDIVVGAPPSRT